MTDSDFTSQNQTDIIRATGEVVQIIPPSDHGKYLLGDVAQSLVDDRHVVVIDTREDTSGIKERLVNLIEWMNDPGSQPDGMYDVFVSDPEFEEGDEVTMDLRATAPTWYEVVDQSGTTGSDQ